MTPEYIIKLAEQEKLKRNHSLTLREAAKLALTAMEEAVEYAKYIRADHYMRPYAIQTLRDALADQSEQALEMVEPVAWTTMPAADDWIFISGSADPNGKLNGKWTALYTATPQRKPLTDEELDALAIDEDGLPNSHFEFARAIERAHGIGSEE